VISGCRRCWIVHHLLLWIWFTSAARAIFLGSARGSRSCLCLRFSFVGANSLRTSAIAWSTRSRIRRRSSSVTAKSMPRAIVRSLPQLTLGAGV